MMKFRLHGVLVALVVFTLWQIVIPPTAYACSCGYIPTVKEELEHSKVVFAGRVINMFPNPDGGPLKYKGENSATVEVIATWKGTTSSQTIVSRGLGGGPCELSAKVGQSFLIYAYLQDDGTLSTGTCGQTKELYYAWEDLEVLGQGRTVAGQPSSIKSFEQYAAKDLSVRLNVWADAALTIEPYAPEDSVVLLLLELAAVILGAGLILVVRRRRTSQERQAQSK